MSCVQITDVQVLDNPTSFLNPFQFEITFECIRDLQEDLQWKVIYVGSAESEEYDQVLDDILVGPISVGTKKFVFQTPPPDVSKLPPGDILGVTVVLLTCSYRNHEFIRVGYYVNNELPGDEQRATELTTEAQQRLEGTMAGETLPPTSSSSAQTSSTTTDADTANADDDNDMDEDEDVPVVGIEETDEVIPARREPVDPAQVMRNILDSKPRITRFPIEWDSLPAATSVQQQQ